MAVHSLAALNCACLNVQQAGVVEKLKWSRLKIWSAKILSSTEDLNFWLEHCTPEVIGE